MRESYHNYIGRRLREEDDKKQEFAKQSENRITVLENKVAKLEQVIRAIERTL